MQFAQNKVIELTAILADATAAISSGYFRVAIAGGDPVYRERVYCYELYHQMRLRWPEQCGFALNGELDKAAHPIFTKLGVGSAKPDFLVHRAGRMDGESNHAIIEIKSASAQTRNIRDDLQKLDQFIRVAEYQRAIYLFFGNEADDKLLNKVQTIAMEFEGLVPIELWLHSRNGEPATQCATLPP